MQQRESYWLINRTNDIERLQQAREILEVNLNNDSLGDRLRDKVAALLIFMGRESEEHFVIPCKDIASFIKSIDSGKLKIRNIQSSFQGKKASKKICGFCNSYSEAYDLLSKDNNSLISTGDLWILLTNAIKEGIYNFSDIKPLLERAEFINRVHLWQALTIAERDEGTSFSDILFMLERAKELRWNHLESALNIALRDKTIEKNDIDFMFKKTKIITQEHRNLVKQIIQRRN